MFLQSLIHMISLVKMHEDSEYEIFRLAESKNCFEMSFSPCVIILSFRRRSLMMNTKRYVGKKKKKHSWMISTTHPEAPEEIIKINKSNVQRKDWLTGCFFYYLFLCLSDDASWSKYVQDVGEVIWFTGTAVTRGCWRVWSRLGLSQSFSLRGNISNAVDKECICEIKGFHRERCVKVWYRKYHQALAHRESLGFSLVYYQV